MQDQPPIPEAPRPEPVSPLRPLADLGGVLIAIIALLVVVRSERPRPTPVVAAVYGPKVAKPAPPQPPPPAPTPPPRTLALDRVAVGRAEAALDAASRDRERAEARVAEATRALASATMRVAAEASASRRLAYRVRDPSARIASASSRGGFLRAERDKLKGEVAVLLRAPRPRARTLVDKNPVARPTDGDEYHFEVRRNRVAFVDLERLLTLVKSDAQLRIRLADNTRTIDSKVGPVGAFSMQYVIARAMPNGIEELMERRGVSYDMRSWEIIPEFEGRGETYEAARQPVSDYARAINRLSPSRSTITMWVYPDGFGLYRKLRDDLHARGYVVAARPLPETMTIRGSPGGSLSAGQ